ncbi:helix-turn-helix domain-containing protein [Magnetospirillum sulfuroxidans]|uniref:Helix-turn-helix transcriptional regulator n=1 Tax=Magnetospirillum sulfuroxidans TaxID=611300 RepID=A0ABS5I7H9_9PROT|nr:helix-turn-helix transcriptional regulator [Magnetospirillum sulfuroxidans]MBR9970370.1 helix-turn-helix transcriptional regulator [Magnetospirillum sulfuroxidans]
MTDAIPAENAIDPIDANLGRRIRARRTVLMLSCENLAKALAIPPEQLHKMENGSERVTPVHLHALSRFLEVPVSYFFDGMPRELQSGFPGTPFADLGALGCTGEDMRETLDLLRAYMAIVDSGDRQRVHELAQTLAEKTEV